MADKPKKLPVHTSPDGTARYPWLNRPDTKWKTEGEYKVDLIIPADEAEELIALIDAAAPEAEAEAKAKYAKLTPPKKKKAEYAANSAILPYEEEYDDEEKPTGNLIFKFKSKASGVTKDGKQWERQVRLFDAKGKPSKANIYAGSTLSVAFQINPWCNPKLAYGVSLRMEAVQIIDLVTGSGGNAGSFGFGERDDGYVADEEEDATTTESDDDESDDDDGEEDF